MKTRPALLLLSIDGHEDEREVTLHYSHTPATGDAWEEPFYPASVLLEGVDCAGLDLLPLLSDKQRGAIESDLLGHEAEAREPDPDFLRERALI